ncbi:alpha/beta hydrolase [Methylocapsa palsarum]|uniref:alpha/beta hydrolase n=1 Tax=Methylocapsa palsarum TaxID=1612308 RepID=UPI001FCD86B6|nr:alpha/beta hydrolase [Methylocapsa palsarum]
MCCVVAGFWHLFAARSELSITSASVGATPITIYREPSDKAAPVVVIAHGFAGSQQLMQPFALTLARNGYIVATFDFLGHGQNPAPLPGGIADPEASGKALIGELGDVVAYARHLQFGDGKIALIGHSMASDIVVRYAEDHPDIETTIAVSLFSRGITADAPRNLLVIDGALEPSMLTDEAFKIAAMANNGTARERVTYGDFKLGTARRVSLSAGVEHIGVLYARESLSEALAWLNEAFGRNRSGFIDARGPWLGLLFAGLVALARPLSGLLPQASSVPLGQALPWPRLIPVALAPAVITPLVLWKLPTDFMPILLGDYLTLHFGVYGFLSAAGLYYFEDGSKRAASFSISRRAFGIGVAAVASYAIFVIGLPIDRFVTSFMPIAERLPLILIVLCGTAPYFMADEWLTRGEAAPRGNYAFTKICFLASLAIAIALNLHRLFFLIIIVPVILIFFTVYGLFSGWVYRRTNHPLVAALGIAIAMAWSIAVTFPTVSP